MVIISCDLWLMEYSFKNILELNFYLRWLKYQNKWNNFKIIYILAFLIITASIVPRTVQSHIRFVDFSK